MHTREDTGRRVHDHRRGHAEEQTWSYSVPRICIPRQTEVEDPQSGPESFTTRTRLARHAIRGWDHTDVDNTLAEHFRWHCQIYLGSRALRSTHLLARGQAANHSFAESVS
jgi:hypothetical protein